MTPKINIKEVGLFHTPASLDELMNWIERLSGSEKIVALTAYGMTWNFLAKQVNQAQGETDVNND